jgi:glycosyltransferase involved in cell wall biosynthesis
VSAALSLCMIVRDEAPGLGRCLASVAGVADELVVVDTGSVDDTVAVARGHGARVVHHDFGTVDFAAARNQGLDHATGRFILVLDADETLDPASVPLVRACVAAGGDTGYVVNRRNFQPAAAEPAWLDHSVRLFPNRAAYRYRRRVHETVDESILDAGGRLRRSGITVNHYLPDERAQRAKGRRYLDLLLEDVAVAPDDPDRLVFLAAEYHKLEMYAEATGVAARVAALCPDDFTARFTAALYHFVYAGDPARARADLDAALRLRPGDPEGLALLRAIGDAERVTPDR